jgi:hypothetical protein
MKNPLTDLHKSLQVCAKRLSIEDYALVSGTLFQLHCGYNFGYKKHDQQFLTDIHLIWKINHKKKIEKQAKILKLKVIRGGKNEK